MQPPTPNPITQIETGSGRIVLRAHGSTAVFTELSYTYPLKLLSPRIDQEKLAVVYVLTYGGGLVGGDIVRLTVDVGPSALLVVLSQVSLVYDHNTYRKT
jgi:urease accessory protein